MSFLLEAESLKNKGWKEWNGIEGEERLTKKKPFKTGLITVKFKSKSLPSPRFQIRGGVTTQDISDSENNQPPPRAIHSLSVPFNLDSTFYSPEIL